MPTTDDYLASIHLALVESPIITSYPIMRQRSTSQSGYLRVPIQIVNGDFLEAAEYFRQRGEEIHVVDYRHQWMEGDRRALHRRWDNAPHHSEVSTAPHHIHDGEEDTILPGQALSIQQVLEVIKREIELRK